MRRLFRLGAISMTPGVTALLPERPTVFGPVPDLAPLVTLFRRHVTGDWGDLDPEDVKANRAALVHGTRLVSAYTLAGEKVWIITEADRSSTTALLPEEY